MKAIITALVFFAIVPLAQAAVVGKEVTYMSGDTLMKGYIARDDAITGKRPGIIVVHEWWGHNDYTRRRADMLAALGYTALAVDMYGEGKTASHPDDAGKFAGAVRSNMAVAEARFRAAMETLASQETVNPEQISAIGYCFGGGIVLAMARSGADLDLVASFHGSVATDKPVTKGQVKARLAVFNGAADPMVTAAQLEAFKSEMDAAGVDYILVSYPDALHAFTNPDADAYAEEFGLPLKYDAAADADSWKRLLELLKQVYVN
ncbi:MAG: dienelactone hydrolase family protein [Gammaproteobacteria bacterium]|jgi:dienelactone hydrolase